ncbi:MAG: 50S ribosomal protein L2 [Patescibacteria group bacterium]|nr:50S ribosomal protein L2 [Patescibacteria group bacterium]
MAIKLYKPTTSARRKMSVVDYSGLTKKNPERSLVMPVKRSFGRDSQGHISIRHKGGGAKRMLRLISNLQKKMDKAAAIEAIEYDPNRSGFIALIKYEDGERSYILCPEGLKIGDKVVASEKAEIKTGNRLKLKNITTGIEIYDIELIPGRGKGQIVKSAGSAAVVAAQAEGSGKRAQYVQVKLPSGEIRLIHGECFASIGRVSNLDHSSMRIAKAGRKRHMGIRPSVRGKVMSPKSHPHGGGEGVNSIGLKYPKTPWGKPALGYKTRKNKYSNKFIIKRKND